MKTCWMKGMKDAQDKEDIKVAYKQGIYLRKRLLRMLEDKIDERDRSSLSDEEYECPNWAYKQAATQGYKKALAEIISLISDKS